MRGWRRGSPVRVQTDLWLVREVLRAGYPARFFPAVRGTAGRADEADAHCLAQHWQGIQRGKNGDPAAGAALYTYIGTGEASEKGEASRKGAHNKGKRTEKEANR